MKQRVLLDTGPLVAFLNRRDRYHEWARSQLSAIEPPLLTCEAVLSEACFLLNNVAGGSTAIMELLDRRLVDVSFRLVDETGRVKALLKRYATVPMALADACLVRMAEQQAGSAVMTLDADFGIYRKNSRQAIPVLMPDDRASKR